jgi:hypothetical protein
MAKNGWEYHGEELISETIKPTNTQTPMPTTLK